MAQKNKKTYKLKNLSIKKVDLVKDGANPDAFVNLFKSKEPVSKQAESFADKLHENSLSDIFDQIWQFTSALSSSFIDILRDEDAADKVALMNTSLDEFYAATGLAVDSWGKGKLSDYRVSDVAVPAETAAVIKGIILKNVADGLDEGLAKAIENEPERQTTENEEGDVDMKFDKSKLTAEELAQLEALEKKAGIPDKPDDTPPAEPPKTDESGTNEDVKKSVPDDDKPNGGNDDPEDIYKGLHPAVVEELKALRKSRDEAEKRELTSVAKKYEIIGKKPDELASVLKSLRDAGGTAYDDMINTLDAMVETVEKSGVFNEVGSNGHKTGEGSTAIAKARTFADEIKKSNPTITDDQAMAKAWMAHPELMDEYDSEIGG